MERYRIEFPGLFKEFLKTIEKDRKKADSLMQNKVTIGWDKRQDWL